MHAPPAQSFRSRAAQPSPRRAWPARGDRPRRERVSVIEFQNSCWKRALNTTAASNQRRPARTSAWALNDGHESKGNQVLPWYVLSPYKKCILYVILYLSGYLLMCNISDLISRHHDLHGRTLTFLCFNMINVYGFVSYYKILRQ